MIIVLIAYKMYKASTSIGSLGRIPVLLAPNLQEMQVGGPLSMCISMTRVIDSLIMPMHSYGMVELRGANYVLHGVQEGLPTWNNSYFVRTAYSALCRPTLIGWQWGLLSKPSTIILRDFSAYYALLVTSTRYICFTNPQTLYFCFP